MIEKRARRLMAPDEGSTGGPPIEPPVEGGSGGAPGSVPPQVIHLALTALVLVVVFLLARTVLVPPSFGQTGFYRSDSVQEHASKPLSHAGKEACRTCHEDKFASPHVVAGVACESCHGPAEAHVQDFEKMNPAKPTSRAFCGVCHQKMAGRPASLPQQDLATHNPTEKCITCHTMHPPQEVK